ncbi:MAG TPA: hypothetical protein VD905_13500 [Flavobacteriales bacterium]|nr:hypothetical protein [Flavobacteriales bacterium]
MKTLTIFIAAMLMLQSCNMGRYYATMRIGHDEDDVYSANQCTTKIKNKSLAVAQKQVLPESKTDSLKGQIVVQQEKMQPTITLKKSHIPTAPVQPVAQKVHTRKTYTVCVKKKNFFTVHKAKRKIQRQIRKNDSLGNEFDWGEFLTGLGEALLFAGLIVLIIATWEALAPFWIILGVIALIALGIVIGIAIIIGSVLDIIFGGL